MEIAPGVFQITSAAVNLFVIDTGDGLMLVDTGLPRDGDKNITVMRSLGLDLGRVKAIVLTHGDIDHIGGAAQFKALTNAPILAHRLDVGFINGTAKRTLPRQGLGLVIGPVFDLVGGTLLRLTPVEVEQVVADGEVLAGGWRVLHLPGHTPGQVGLYHPTRRVVIAADALANRKGLTPPPPIFTPDMAAARASIRKLAALDFDTLGMGHGPALTNGAGAAVRAFAASLRA